MANSLDPHQARRFVGPDPGPNCLQRFTADVTGRQRVNVLQKQDFIPTPLVGGGSVELRCWLVFSGSGNSCLIFAEGRLLITLLRFSCDTSFPLHEITAENVLPSLQEKVIETNALNKPRREKTGLRCFGPGPTQTGLRNHGL